MSAQSLSGHSIAGGSAVVHEIERNKDRYHQKAVLKIMRSSILGADALVHRPAPDRDQDRDRADRARQCKAGAARACVQAENLALAGSTTPVLPKYFKPCKKAELAL